MTEQPKRPTLREASDALAQAMHRTDKAGPVDDDAWHRLYHGPELNGVCIALAALATPEPAGLAEWLREHMKLALDAMAGAESFGSSGAYDGSYKDIESHAAKLVQELATARETIKALQVDAERLSNRSPIDGERFVRGWLNLGQLPGGMMMGNEGRFGPIGGMTSCMVTTSEIQKRGWTDSGEPVMEVWAAIAAAKEQK